MKTQLISMLGLSLALGACGSSGDSAGSGVGDGGDGPACGAGTHAADGQCVPDAAPATCGAGTHLEGAACVPDAALACGEGTRLEGGACVPATTPIVCGEGTRLEGGACVPVSELTCAEGTRLEGGVCVPSGPTACGPGTFAHAGECLPYDPGDATAPSSAAVPPGGPTRALPAFVVIAADEAAVIHYTLDGSEPTDASPSDDGPLVLSPVTDGLRVRWFALDRAGNAEAPHDTTFTLDTTGPRAAGLTLTAVEGGVRLDWTADADAVGALVAVGRGQLGGFEPEAGETYATGPLAGGPEALLLVGDARTFVDAAPAPGYHHYRVWAVDAAGNYGPPASADRVVPVPAQTARLTLTLPGSDGGGATGAEVVEPASLLALAATATFDAELDRLTVELTVTSHVARPLFNLKAFVEPLEAGTLNGATVYAGEAFAHFGPQALGEGQSRKRTLAIDGLAAAGRTTLDVSLRFEDAPALFAGARSDAPRSAALVVDTAAPTVASAIPCSALSYNVDGGRCAIRAAALSADGRTLFVATRSMPALGRLDTTTLEVEPGAWLGGFGSLDALAWDARRDRLLAVFNGNGHARLDGDKSVELGDVELCALSPDGRRVLARTTLLAEAGDAVRGRSLAVSPDGARAAVALAGTGRVVLVDLEAFAPIDVDPEGEARDVLVGGGGTRRPTALAFSADGTRLYVGELGHERTGLPEDDAEARRALSVVTLADHTVTTVEDAYAQPSGLALGGLVVDGHGHLWSGVAYGIPASGAVLSRMPGAEAPAWTTYALGRTGESSTRLTSALALSRDGTRLWVTLMDGRELAALDTATGEAIDLDGDAGNAGSNVNLPVAPGQHWLVPTPF